MKKIIIILLFLLLQGSFFVVFCRCSNSIPEKAQNSIYDDLTLSDIKYIKSIEKKLFNCDFENEDLNMRLERLEKRLLGTISSGNYTERLYKINNALNGFEQTNSYTTYSTTTSVPYYPFNPYYNYNYNYNSIYPLRQRQNKIRAMRNFINGNVTGYTIPPVHNIPAHNNSNFMNVFSNGSSSDINWSRGGFYRRNMSTDGGVGVTIISD